MTIQRKKTAPHDFGKIIGIIPPDETTCRDQCGDIFLDEEMELVVCQYCGKATSPWRWMRENVKATDAMLAEKKKLEIELARLRAQQLRISLRAEACG